MPANNKELHKAVNFLERYDLAMSLKRAGDYQGAATLFLESVSPPSIYHGHYEQLFICWRKMNKEDYVEKEFVAPLSRLKMMHQLNIEMLKTMSKYWSSVNKCEYGDFHFLTYSKIKSSDTKNLRKYAEMLEDREGLQLADYYSEL